MTPKPLPICEENRHVWEEPFTDGDTCACGRFYLDLHSAHGWAAEVTATPEPEEP